MRVNLSKTGSYIPEWEGNRGLIEAEQIKVNYTNLSSDLRKKFRHQDKTQFSLETTATAEEIDAVATEASRRMEFSIWEDTAGLVKAMAPTIENLEDENGNAIDTWAKLLAAPASPENQLQALVTEIETSLGKAQERPDPKN